MTFEYGAFGKDFAFAARSTEVCAIGVTHAATSVAAENISINFSA
jgi:hypothetical protein